MTWRKKTVNQYDIEVDATQQGETIPNLVSNLNVWNMAGIDQQSGKMCIMIYNFGNSLNYASQAEISLSIRTDS